MLVALLTVMLLAGGGPSLGEGFVKQLDKIVGKQLKDPAAKAQAKSAVDEIQVTFEEYNSLLKQTLRVMAKAYEDRTVNATEFENAIQVVDGARAQAFERLVTSRAKLRQAIPAEQWDGIVGAAAKKTS